MWIKVQSHFHDYIMHINCKKSLYKSVFAICILAKGLSWGLATGLETAFPHCIFMMCCFSAEKLYKANAFRNWCICLFSTVGQQCFLALKNQPNSMQITIPKTLATIEKLSFKLQRLRVQISNCLTWMSKRLYSLILW